MDRLIKSVPVIVIVCLLGFMFQSDDSEFSNLKSAGLCALVVFMLTALVYIVRVHKKWTMMKPGRYFLVMVIAALIAYVTLFASLEYFYN